MKQRTGRLALLICPLSAFDRGSRTVHAAEEIASYSDHLGKMLYPEFTALCGAEGWGEAGGSGLQDVTCKNCRRTRRYREAAREAT